MSAPPKLDAAAQSALITKAQALAAKYRTEMLQKAWGRAFFVQVDNFRMRRHPIVSASRS